ncbi:peptidyl-prolyl cis-trans isomerase [Treponema sp. OMZ 840]|uniref:MOSP complex formation periplasmic protein, TDE1658 family n=1 Tax=Treponema sp. OMZ 840 TaxID=244313 RepID=UPI003D9255BC
MKRLFAVLFVFSVTVFFASAQNDLQPLVTIKLNKTESITLKQLKNRVAVYQKQTGMPSFTVEQKKEILDAMIDEKLALQAAQKAGLSITDAAVNDYFLNSIAAQVGQPISEQEFAALIKSQSGMSLDDYFSAQIGMNLSEYKNFLKNQLIAQQYVMSLKRNELQSTSVSDAEIRSFFEINKSNFVQNDILKLFLVVIPKGKDAESAKKTADSLRTDLKNKKTTYAQLKVKGKLENSGFQAGDMYVSKGTLAAQQLGMDYDALLKLFSQNVGFMSDVTETPSDFQFYTVQEKYAAKILALDDEVQPDTAITVYEYIKQQIGRQKEAAAFASAVEDVMRSLRTPENYHMLKTGDALNKLLDW